MKTAISPRIALSLAITAVTAMTGCDQAALSAEEVAALTNQEVEQLVGDALAVQENAAEAEGAEPSAAPLGPDALRSGDDTAQTLAADGMELLVPLYAWPSAWTDSYADDCSDAAPAAFDSCMQGKSLWAQWQQVAAKCQQTPMTVIINPGNGPLRVPTPEDPLAETAFDKSDWQTGMALLKSAGCTTLGYVKTEYGAFDMLPTLYDMVAYAGHTDGIFYDEVKNFGVTTTDAENYGLLVQYARSFVGTTIMNPGSAPTWAPGHGALGTNPYADAPFSAMITAESDAATIEAVTAPSWQKSDSRGRYGVLAHGAHSEEQARGIVTHAYNENFGYIYVSDDTIGDGNPWDTVTSFLDSLALDVASANAWGAWTHDDLINYCFGSSGPSELLPGQCSFNPIVPDFCIVLDKRSPYYYETLPGVALNCYAL